MKITTGTVIEECMRRKGWTIDDLSKRTGVSKRSLTRYKKEPDMMSLGTAKKMCEVFGIDIKSFCGGEI